MYLWVEVCVPEALNEFFPDLDVQSGERTLLDTTQGDARMYCH